jgi:hypothetical protein
MVMAATISRRSGRKTAFNLMLDEVPADKKIVLKLCVVLLD